MRRRLVCWPNLLASLATAGDLVSHNAQPCQMPSASCSTVVVTCTSKAAKGCPPGNKVRQHMVSLAGSSKDMFITIWLYVCKVRLFVVELLEIGDLEWPSPLKQLNENFWAPTQN
jgi:hypothetical protein